LSIRRFKLISTFANETKRAHANVAAAFGDS
jgi:hypothetical protein